MAEPSHERICQCLSAPVSAPASIALFDCGEPCLRAAAARARHTAFLFGCVWIQCCGQRSDGRILKHLRKRYGPAEAFLELPLYFDHDERIPARLEEVVVDAD